MIFILLRDLICNAIIYEMDLIVAAAIQRLKMPWIAAVFAFTGSGSKGPDEVKFRINFLLI